MRCEVGKKIFCLATESTITVCSSVLSAAVWQLLCTRMGLNWQWLDYPKTLQPCCQNKTLHIDWTDFKSISRAWGEKLRVSLLSTPGSTIHGRSATGSLTSHAWFLPFSSLPNINTHTAKIICFLFAWFSFSGLFPHSFFPRNASKSLLQFPLSLLNFHHRNEPQYPWLPPMNFIASNYITTHHGFWIWDWIPTAYTEQ